MYRKLSLLFLLFIIPFITYCQMSITGVVKDVQNKPIAFANVITLNSNNELIAGVITNENGEFKISVNTKESFNIVISFIGFENWKKEISETKNIVLDQITLKESNNELDEVKITAVRPTIKRKVDRLVFDVGSSPIASNGTVWDAVLKSPSINSDSEGNLRAFNKSAKIMIDGRLQSLDPESLSEMLRSMFAENILEIEIITSPPAKYDAEGQALINIVTKKQKSNGYVATINSYYEQSKYSRGQIGGNIISKINKLDVNLNYSLLDGDYRETDNENILYPNGNIWVSNNETKIAKNSNVYSLSLNYNVNDKNVIGIQASGFNLKKNRVQNVETDIFNSSENPDSTLLNRNTPKSKISSNSINLNYNKKTSKKGNISFDFDYTTFKSENNQNLSTISFDSNEVEKYSDTSNIMSSQDIIIKSIKLDYSHKLGKESMIEGGVKLSSIDTDNNNFISGNFIVNNLQFDKFLYEEINKAAYLSFNSKVQKLEFKAGIRVENTKNEGVSLSTNQSNNQDYLEIFPVFSILYNLTEDSSIDFEYRRGLKRPGYWRLNPFRYYTTPYSYIEGNPFLRPSISNSLAMSYVLKNKYVFVCYYNKWEDDFTQVTVQDLNNQVLNYSQENLGSSEDFGLYFILPLKINNWWESNIDIELSRKIDASNYLNSRFRFSNNKFYFTSNNFFSISKEKNWTAEISGWYNSSNLQGLFKSNSTFDVSMGMQKYLLDKRLRLSFSFFDVFWRNATRTFVEFEDQNYNFFSRQSTKKFRFSVSYKFRNNKKEYYKIQERKAKEERDRLSN